MAIDWIETLTAAGEIAKQAAIDLPKQLATEDLTVLEASRLYSETERKAQAMDRLIEKMPYSRQQRRFRIFGTACR